MFCEGDINVQKVNLSKALLSFDDFWSLKIIGEVNKFHVKLVKVEGEFVWHQHESEDELTHLLVLEPATTRNTGNVTNERTVEKPERL